MKRANILRTAFGVAIALGLVFDGPDAVQRTAAEAPVAAAVAAPANARLVETVAAPADACAAAKHDEPDAASEQREL